MGNLHASFLNCTVGGSLEIRIRILLISEFSRGPVLMMRFDRFTLDPLARSLHDAGREVHLSPKALDLLTLLIERRPDVVGKHELIATLWPETFVSDGNLAVVIREIRRVLGDAASRPRFVRTAHRKGYSFCAAVVERPRAEPATWWLASDRGLVPLPDGETILGRGTEAHVCCPTDGVSRRHARLTVRGLDVTLEDLGSKNGTYLNGKRVSALVHLTSRDEFRLGPISSPFTITSASTSTDTVPSNGSRPTPLNRRATGNRAGRPKNTPVTRR